MKIILAESAGFCKGVRRAMTKILEDSEMGTGTIYTDGPLIHNPQTIKVLESRGVRVMDEETKLGENDTIFIRSHGISPQRRAEIKQMGGKVTDATCPDVARIHGIVRKHRKKGDMIVIVGNPNHAEIIGLKGMAEEDGHVVSKVEDVAGLPDAESVCVVAQTTSTREHYDEIIEAIKKRYTIVNAQDTICPSTYRRQNEVLKIAREADVTVVVGGKNSSNTRHLAEVSESVGTPAFHIETADELNEADFEGVHKVAVTAGASTPNWILMDVVDRLKEFKPKGSNLLLHYLKSVGRHIIRTNLYVALGSAMLCYANSRLMGVSLGWLPYAIAFCYILSMHIISRLSGQSIKTAFAKVDLTKAERRERTMLRISIASAALALILAGSQGITALAIMVVLLGFGMIYRLEVPGWLLAFGSRKISLRLIPASKDLFMALGWSTVTVLFPLFIIGHPLMSPELFLTFASTFLLVSVRSILFDLRDIQGDSIVGRETLPTIIGTRKSSILLYTMTALQAAVIVAGAAGNWLTSFAWLMLPISGYIFAYLFLFQKRILRSEFPVEFTGDSQFVIAGILALLFTF